jgi:heme-degrading monooxygenase HmoA
VLPSIHKIEGFFGYELFRSDAENGESEFVTVTYFESLDSVRAFAGDEYKAAGFAASRKTPSPAQPNVLVPCSR